MDLNSVVVDLAAIAHNTHTLKDLVAPGQLMCVVKANGYNHGGIEVARTMSANGADQFGVATIQEALELRRAGITQPILSWIWSPEGPVVEAIENDIDLAVFSIETAEAIAALARRGVRNTQSTVRVTIKVDTGMHRSGLSIDHIPEVARLLHQTEGVDVTGMMSHLAAADTPDDPLNDEQVTAFRKAIALGRSHGLTLGTNHIANSAALLSRSDCLFDMARPGLALYGAKPFPMPEWRLCPAMRWEAKVSVVKPVSRGEGVSYSHTWHAPADGYIAVIPIGYADGLPRRLQGSLEVDINGRLYPNIGRICMDQFIIDLGGNEHRVAVGDTAVLFGSDTLDVDHVAEQWGTINYEVICSPTGRTSRLYREASS
ncbi:alanine racemase [Corynebacterium sp. ES2794-CONJ1]|uniref:alanine racemase n=1 Tax=unclassified Corynebacterium TaxID=2624378 RepID=UPI002166CDC3|nr:MULTISPECIES: alanine racemase [unclassified Corynebacterium]MCS4489575.1 alanine racemase [Corynebacterium sp. ES2775-CONJ]MCS4491414.1 alanine racemase [Corynebacterium sp. ES2715-CONJ3]MCU9518873.1 alanine racemase [Corynebacterium sp. ES2794-CONJ1]